MCKFLKTKWLKQEMTQAALPHTEKTWNIWSRLLRVSMWDLWVRQCGSKMLHYSSVKPSLNPFQYSYQLWSRVEDAFAFYRSRQTVSFHRGENPMTSLWPQEYGRSFSGWLEHQNTHSYTAGVWRAKLWQSFTKGFWRKIALWRLEFNVYWGNEI